MLVTRRTIATVVILGAATLLALVWMTTGARGAGCTKTWKGGSGSWETASDWTPEGAPASTDDVCITAPGTYTVTLNSNTTIASLDLGATASGGTQTLEMQPPVRLEATAGGTIDEQGALTLEGNDTSSTTLFTAGSGTLTNAGTLTLGVGAPTTSFMDLVGNVTNTGTIDVNTNASYSDSGKTLDNEGRLRLANAVTFEDDNATVIDDSGGKIEAEGTGKLETSEDSSVYEQGDGTTSGSEPVVLENGALHYTGNGASSIVVETGAPLVGNISAGQSVTLRGSSSLTASASFTNAGTITLDATSGYPKLLLSEGTLLSNSGTITTRASGVSPDEPEIVGDLTNTGTINIDTTSYYAGYVAETLDNKGAVKIANGATFEDGHTFINDSGGSIEASGSGKLETVSNAGVFDQGEGTTSGSEPVVMERTALDYTGTGQSTIVVIGGVSIEGNISQGQSLKLRDSGFVQAAESFTNAGAITFDATSGSPSVRLGSGTLTNSGTLTTEASGESPGEPFLEGSLANTGTIDVERNSSFEGFTNAKTLTISEGQTLKASSFAQTAGTTTLAGNSSATTLDVSSAKLEGGVLDGVGTIKGNLVNDGRLAPGTTTPGTISVTGSYAQQAGGELAIDVAEGGADRLAVTGTATLAGALAVSTTGFSPTVGHTYTPVTDSLQGGEFQTVTGLSSGPYEVKYNPANVELAVLASEPPAISIGNVTMRNPDSGNGTAKFTVTLSKASRTQVSVHYATTDGIARAPGDYEATSGTLTFAPGETQATIEVTVHGTSEPTADRTFFVDLSNPKAATISQAQGAATVQNDHIALTSVTPAEGGQGGTATITLIGAGFSGTPTVTLVRAGRPDIVATNVTPDATAQAMTATFDLSAAAIGAYEVVASLPAFAKSAALPEAFTVGEAEPANVTDELIGFPTVSTGEPWTGQLVYTNTGTVDAHNAILEVGGFQSGAHVTVSGPNVTGSVEEDNGISHTVQVYVSLIPAESTNVALVTFTPVGNNGSEYALQPSTFVSSDESFTQGASEPSVTARNVVGSETATSVQGSIDLESSGNTPAGNVAYDVETQESSLPGGGSIPQPSVTETALPDGEERYELQATLPPEAQGPPPYSPTSLLSPGEFSTCNPSGCFPVESEGEGALSGVGGIASPLSRNPGKRRAASLTVVRPDASASSVLDELKARYEAANGVIEKLKALADLKGAIEAANQKNEEQQRISECLRSLGAIGGFEAEREKNLSDGANAAAKFDELAKLTGVKDEAGNKQALELLNSVIQSSWGESLFGGGKANGGQGEGTGDLAVHGINAPTLTNGQPNPFANPQLTPQQRLESAQELCPPKKEKEKEKEEKEKKEREEREKKEKEEKEKKEKEHKPKPKPKPKGPKGPKKPHPPKRLKVRNSHDPNELVGPEGYGNGNFVAPEEPLAYEAMFTNEATAGASAREVRVSDQLDPTKLDLSTFSFGPLYFGSTIAAPPPGLQSWKDIVDLRPAKNLLVEINANLNAQTGLVTWNLQAIDPETGLQPVNPEDGFLPPDTTPPDGVGGASFTVYPQAELPTGTQILDNATIVFDQNAPIATEDWLNTIDASTPSSQIDALTPAAGGVCGNLGVSWSGTDTGAGIDHYDIYVSQNGGPFDIWQPLTQASNAIYPGVAGSSYRFSSVATDGVGHSETVPGTPSASILAGCPAGLVPAASKGPSTSSAASPGLSISHLTFSPAAFAVGKSATAIAARASATAVFARSSARKKGAKPPTGTTIGYDLSGSGTVAIAIEKKLAGVKLKGRGCVAATAATRKELLLAAERTLGHRGSAAARKHKLAALLRQARCTALQSLGALTRAGKAGANQIPFSGRLGSRALTPGSYLARASATPATTPPSTASASFKILPASSRKPSHKS